MNWFHIAGLALIASTSVVGMPKTADAQTIGIVEATLGETGGETPEASTQDMRRIVEAGGAIILDSRSQAEFDAGHIPGAKLVGGSSPSEHLAAVLRRVDADKSRPLVLYCNGPFCQASRRLADQLADAGFTNVKRYQLGIPVWRALGGPTAIELDAVRRIASGDRLAVFVDVRPADDFAKGSLPGARNAPLDAVVSGKLKKVGLPEDDFNRRVVLFGRDGADARKLAEFLSTRPWHNVAYFNGPFDAIRGLNVGASETDSALR